MKFRVYLFTLRNDCAPQTILRLFKNAFQKCFNNIPQFKIIEDKGQGQGVYQCLEKYGYARYNQKSAYPVYKSNERIYGSC